ncbi:endonuclease/exonuclease/phosphatase family protein [Kitasatospora sp. NBC_01287]|uniref:endonuclease/exonuclease/phosphatase family protein n=1 Tax=Kitasatospora sp. NBC_01287 TaxID=2903573 RepID=UPI00224E247B|nr:endonuclease/exonuclease/phosphatase family protein [Kitasatospora sp. NBC_01287]MCX4751405.1 endonuclease/exonuclease/phosphatase family protein [Kitasatospora sp. NBC_01287]
MSTASFARPSRRSVLRAAVLPSAVVASLVLAALPAVAAGAAGAGQVRIHDIQGTTRISPLNGQSVQGVPGIVTGIRSYGSSKGFWFQDPNPDRDPRTSEGVFVYTGSTPKVAVGDSVLVDAKVSEYYPDYADGYQSVTELTKPTVTVLSSGNALPTAVKINGGDIPGRYAPQNGSASIESLTLQPEKYALDFYESLEGMRVEVDNTRVVGATDAYSELWVDADPGDQRSARGGTLYESYQEPNGGRLQIQSLVPTAQQPFPSANVGDRLTGATVGPLDYNQYAGGYTLVATQLGALQDNHLQRQVAPQASDNQATIATYNVENLAPSDSAAKFAGLAQGVVTNLRSPDVVALEEIQDNSGATNDGTVDASATVAKFVAAIKAAGGPTYDWRSIDPVDGQDGGQPGGNIRQVFLFNPDRISFTDIPGGTSTTAVGVTGHGAGTELTASPGRIDPADAAWTASRKPLVGQFSFRGKKLFIIANHWTAKLADQPYDSRFQPPARSSDAQRLQQAQVEGAFVDQLEAADPQADVVSLGDFNDYQFSPALAALTKGDKLDDLVNELPETKQYSYVYDGNSQVLDHILVSPSIGSAQYDVVHINSEFAVQSSDHDPQVVRIRP